VYILALLFAGSFIGQAVVSIPQDGARAFWGEVLANHQSEWLQLVFQAILLLGAKHWLFRVDAEDLERIEDKIDKLTEEVANRGA
jgi:flagellar biosynthesis/type III secretory pathway protein FliH